MNIAVIPARGGSKRIPRKNVRPFCGKPMIEWPIAAVRQSGCFESVIVSTDDDEIAEVARRAGAEVPFMRPARLANDQTGTAEVVRHAIAWHADKGRMPELVCCIYATAAFVTGADLLRGRDLLLEQGADFAFSVCRYGPPVQRALRVDSDGRIEMFQPEYAGARSQDLEPAFHDAGQFYWGTATAWMSGAALFSKASAAVVLPRERVLDIDTPEDWSLAEALFRIQLERSSP